MQCQHNGDMCHECGRTVCTTDNGLTVQENAHTLMRGALPGSIGTVSDNGWTDCSLSVRWLNHFISFANSSQDSPKL